MYVSGYHDGNRRRAPLPVRSRESEDENVNKRSRKDAEGDEGVGPHEGDSHAGKVARGDHAVLVGDHSGGNDAADVVGDGEVEEDADRQQAADGEYVERLGYAKGRSDAETLRYGVEAVVGVEPPVLRVVEDVESGGPQRDGRGENDGRPVE